MFANTLNSIRKFHSDEDGLEALQVVMIVAISAMVLIAVVAVGKAAVRWMNGQAFGLQFMSLGLDGNEHAYDGLGAIFGGVGAGPVPLPMPNTP